MLDPLADMRPLRGDPEYRALVDAFRQEEPGCRDVDAFTADRLEVDELAVLAGICAACPVLELCRAYRIAGQPDVGFWAGAPSGRGATAAA